MPVVSPRRPRSISFKAINRSSGWRSFSRFSWFLIKFSISPRLAWKNSPLNLITPAGTLSLMRWQAGHNSSLAGWSAICQVQRPCTYRAPQLGQRVGSGSFFRRSYGSIRPWENILSVRDGFWGAGVLLAIITSLSITRKEQNSDWGTDHCFLHKLHKYL